MADADLERNQADIDFAEAVLARGGEDARGMRERLAALESERSDLLAGRDALPECEVQRASLTPPVP